MLSLRTAIRILACAALLALMVFVYAKVLHVNPTTVAISFLLVILAVAAAWGLRYSIAMSIAAALCFNFFFLPPVGTLTIADTQNWVALLAFFLTSIIASNLSERARRQTAEAEHRRLDVERLYQFSQQLLGCGKYSGTIEDHATICNRNFWLKPRRALYFSQRPDIPFRS